MVIRTIKKFVVFLRKYQLSTFILILLDIGVLWAAAFLALKARFWPVIDLVNSSGALVHPQLVFLMFYALICVFVFQANGLYRPGVFIYLASQQVLIVKSILWSTLGLVLLSFLARWPVYIIDSRLTIFYFFIFSVVLASFFRLLFFRSVYLWLARTKILQRRVVIVGAGQSGRQVAAGILMGAAHDRCLVGFLDDAFPCGKIIFGGAPNLGPIERVADLVVVEKVQEIIVAISSISHERLLEIVQQCRATGAGVKIYSDLFEIIDEKVAVEHFKGMPLVGINQWSHSASYRVIKRGFDIIGSLVLLSVLLPALGLIGAAIKLTSRGPIFFKQVRIGKDGRPFKFFKFRSMKVNNDDHVHREYVGRFINGDPAAAFHHKRSVYKMVDDPRITVVGRFLRATSLDELPQLFNVLTGDMSLVGPRPCMPYEWEQYEEWHKRRLSVTPGCTGLWQVSGRSTVGFDDMVVLDLYYINNGTPWLDLQLMLKTIPVMVLARGGH